MHRFRHAATCCPKTATFYHLYFNAPIENDLSFLMLSSSKKTRVTRLLSQGRYNRYMTYSEVILTKHLAVLPRYRSDRHTHEQTDRRTDEFRCACVYTVCAMHSNAHYCKTFITLAARLVCLAESLCLFIRK